MFRLTAFLFLVAFVALSVLGAPATPQIPNALARRQATRSSVIERLNRDPHRRQLEPSALPAGRSFRIQVPIDSPATPLRGNYFSSGVSPQSQPRANIPQTNPSGATDYRITSTGRLQLVGVTTLDAVTRQGGVFFLDNTITSPTADQGAFLTCSAGAISGSRLICTTSAAPSGTIGIGEGNGLIFANGALPINVQYP